MIAKTTAAGKAKEADMKAVAGEGRGDLWLESGHVRIEVEIGDIVNFPYVARNGEMGWVQVMVGGKTPPKARPNAAEADTIIQ